MKKFWNWVKNEDGTRSLYLNGTIAEDTWFDDDVTPKVFRDELFAGTGNVVIWINSPGGDCIAASQIYTMLMDYPGNITVKIDGIAASAASVIAMAGDEVIMAKGAMFMIHKAWTGMWGNAEDLRKEAELLDKIDGTLADTYAEKTGKEVSAISEWMAAETWFTAQEALDAGFATSIAEAEAKAGAWNLSAYDNAPKAERAPAPTPEPAPEPEEAMASEDHRKRQAQRLRVLSLLNQ